MAPYNQSVAGCTPTADVGRKPFQLSFRPPPGVGGAISPITGDYVIETRLEIWDGPSYAPFIVASSKAPTNTRYLKADVLDVEPRVLLLDDGLAYTGEAFQLLTLGGHNFGHDDVVEAMLRDNTGRIRNRTLFNPSTFTGYTGSSSGSDNQGDLSGGFGSGYPCATTKRVSVAGQPTSVQCAVEPSNAKVGKQQIFLRVADQTSNAYRDALGMEAIFACKQGYFAPLGGSCMMCPQLGAFCEGYRAPRQGVSPLNVPVQALVRQPVALAGFYDYTADHCGGGFHHGIPPASPHPDFYPTRPGARWPEEWKPCWTSQAEKAAVRALMPRCPYSVQVWSWGSAPGRATSAIRDVCIMPCHVPEACPARDPNGLSPAAIAAGVGGNTCAPGYVSGEAKRGPCGKKRLSARVCHP